MARNNMNFSASLRLNAKQFKQGIADVQRTLNGLKSSFMSFSAALGAGLGFSKIVSAAKDTAQSLSVAKAVLKNVSQEVDEAGYKWDSYASNLEYVKKLSEEYGQDLTNLIEGFGQFHAAANLVLDANGKVALSLNDQKYIYEQLTRAAAGYHMSADRTKDMMNAITQMMSKGKIAAEELRRQLGNALPGAFGLMATAMGVTTMELEDMMRKGKLLSSEALLPFAQELERITKEMSFDSLQQSLNRLKNAWTELVDNASVEDMYKKIVDASTGLLNWIKDHIAEIKGVLKGFIAGISAYFVSNIGVKMVNSIKSIRAEWIKTYDETFAKVEQLYKGAKKVQGVIYSDQTARPMRAKSMADFSLTDKGIKNWQSALKYAKEYNDELLKAHKTQQKLGGKGFLTKQDLTIIKNVEKEYNKIGSYGKMIANQHGIWQKSWGVIKGYAWSVWTAVKGIAVQMAAFAIIGVVVGWVQTIAEKEKERKKYADETARIYADYEADLQKIDDTDGEQIIKLRTQLGILKDCERGSQEWAGALAEVNQKLGLNGDEMLTIESKYEDIEKAVLRWIDRLKLVAKINRQITHQQEAEEQAEDLRSQIDAKAKEYEAKTGYKLGGWFSDLYNGEWKQDQLNKGNVKRKDWIDKNVIPLINRLKEVKRVSDAADASITELTKDLYKNYGTTTTGTQFQTSGDTGDTKVSDIRKVYDNWNKETKELSNKLREHAITQEEYNEEYDKLITKFFENAAETGKYSIDAILKKADKGHALTAMEKWYKMLYESAGEAAQRTLLRGAQDAIDKATDDAIEDFQKVMDEEIEELIEKLDKSSKADMDALLADKPKLGKRDNIFDYKKSNVERSEEELDIMKDNIGKMEDYINGIVGSYDNWADACDAVKQKIEEARQILGQMKTDASTLEEVVKFQKLDEDIKQLGDDLNKAWGNGIKEVAQGTDRVVKGLQNMAEAFGDEIDLEGWTKFMSVFNEIVQIIETLISLYEMFNSISEISSTLEEAKNARQAELNNLLADEIALRLMLKKIQEGNISNTEKQILEDILAKKAAKAATSAKSGEAVANATASGAKLPFPYNLAAIAAGVAAVIGALVSISKFANGGIVGGNSYSGDKQVARVNSGEMILNKAQQGTLWNMLNGKGNAGGQVNFKIRGTDLIGVMNNEMSRRRG